MTTVDGTMIPFYGTKIALDGAKNSVDGTKITFDYTKITFGEGYGRRSMNHTQWPTSINIQISLMFT